MLPSATSAQDVLGPGQLAAEIRRLKAERNAIVLAHYYQEAEIQDLADFVGDSLELARAAQRTRSSIIAFCGVRFMAEVAKILNPDADVWLPDLEAGCSLEESCPPDAFARWRDEHPGHVSLTYINCSAAVKALSDIIVTSSSAERILKQIPVEQPVLFAPDRYLGAYLERVSGRKMVLWPGTCVVHEQFSAQALIELKVKHPEAKVTAHPECPETILSLADHVGSTSAILRFVQESPAREFLVVTEPGIIHQMERLAPGKRFISVPGQDGECGCNTCPYMKRNTLEKLYVCLRDGGPSLELPEDLRAAARIPLDRMLAMTS